MGLFDFFRRRKQPSDADMDAYLEANKPRVQ